MRATRRRLPAPRLAPGARMGPACQARTVSVTKVSDARWLTGSRLQRKCRWRGCRWSCTSRQSAQACLPCRSSRPKLRSWARPSPGSPGIAAGRCWLAWSWRPGRGSTGQARGWSLTSIPSGPLSRRLALPGQRRPRCRRHVRCRWAPSRPGDLYGELQVRPRDWARALLLCQYEHPAIVCWRGRRRAPSQDRTPDL